MNKKIFFGSLALLCIISCKPSKRAPPPAAATSSTGTANNQVILRINDKSFSNNDLRAYIKFQYSNMAGKETNVNLYSRLFDLFIENQLVLYKAEQAGLDVPDEEIANYLKSSNLNPQELGIDLKLIRDMLRVQKYLMLNIYKSINVSDGEIARYHQTHKDEFKKNEEIFLYQILLPDKEKAISLRGELLNSPSRFEEIAQKESISPEASSGGVMGYFEKGVLPKEMEDVVFSLKIDEISPVVTSPYGYHIFKVTQKKPERTQELITVKNEIRNKLLSENLHKAQSLFLQQLRSELNIQVYQDKLFFAYQLPSAGEEKK